MTAKGKALSPHMQQALQMAERNGGALRYHRGGYWAGGQFDPREGRRFVNYVPTQTVRALVARNVGQFTVRSNGMPREFRLHGTGQTRIKQVDTAERDPRNIGGEAGSRLHALLESARARSVWSVHAKHLTVCSYITGQGQTMLTIEHPGTELQPELYTLIEPGEWEKAVLS